MKTVYSLLVIIGISIFGFAAAQAMPQAPLDKAQAGITIPVAGGCGAGWHRGPYGGCRRNGYYGGVYYGGAVVAPGVVVAAPVVVAPVVVAPAPCGGRGMHRVCNPYRCWRVCN
ncbi:MAG TPA: hypothetical protein VKD19_05155 [Pseudolabrys sp.]|nr:hypothetical protein [Pseudolabrys sp.]